MTIIHSINSRVSFKDNDSPEIKILTECMEATNLEETKSPVKKKRNIGEKDEIIAKKKLYTLSTNSTPNNKELVQLFGIDASEGITLINPHTLLPYTNINEIIKSKPCYKCDIIVKINKTEQLYNISIKSENGANAAIINHTPRSAKVFQKEGALNLELHNLDFLVKNLNEKRKNNEFGEDVKLTNLDISDYIKISLTNMMKYFIFEGTGSGYSKIGANSILIINTCDIEKWKFYNCISEDNKFAYINCIYDNCVISLRDKGMPKNPSDICAPWIYKDIKSDGKVKLKGSIHIRKGKGHALYLNII